MSPITLYTLLFACFTQCFCLYIPLCPNPPKNLTELENLNTDCKLVILDILKISDLIAVAEINTYFSNLASNVFRRKFARKTATISLPYKKSELMWEPETPEYFQIACFKKATKLLKYFGHLIRSLHVELFSEIDEENESIKNLINTHCSDSLIEFEIRNFKSSNFFASMTKPFKAIQKVTLHGKFDRLDNSKLKSSELFPAVRELIQGLTSQLDDVKSIGHFPYLERVTADFTQYEMGEVCIAEYLQLVKMNPQIRSLTLIHSKKNLLKFAAEKLQKLEKLELEYYESSDRDDLLPIHFKNVKQFKIIGISVSIPQNISFERLVEFETGGYPKSCLKWIDFVEENKDLEKFQLNDCYLSNQDVLRLAEAELNADEMLLRSDGSINIRSIVRLVESSKHLRKVHLVHSNMTNAVLEELKWNFRNWNIIEGTSTICLEKKK